MKTLKQHPWNLAHSAGGSSGGTAEAIAIGIVPAANASASSFTSLYNITGQPAISVPLHWTPEGLPVGVRSCMGICRCYF